MSASKAKLAALASAAVLAAADAGLAQSAPPADMLITGGLVFDGGEAPGRIADVALAGDRIVFVGDAAKAHVSAKARIDASGKIVAPGFIDPHTHYLEDLSSDDAALRRNLASTMQGVTTVFVGSDGFGAPEIGEALDGLKAKGVGPNVAMFVGFGGIRARVLGEADRAPDAAELDRMRTLAAKGMCEGALGLSTGLFYPPQSYSKTAEVIEVAKEAARRGGVYDSHIRDESTYTIGLKGAVQEVFDIAEGAQIPVHISHIKALGVDVQGQAPQIIAMVEAAQAGGLTVSANQYPWAASGTSLSAALLPRWAQADGEAAMRGRLDDPELGPKIRAAMVENLRRRGGPAAILLTGAPIAEAQNLTLDEAAAKWALDPIEASVRILKAGDAEIASFNQSEADIEAFMRQPWVMTSSDASDGHPRKFASFARKYAHYVKDRGTITLAQFVHRSSGLTADTFGLVERGYLKPGYYADVVVFDPDRYAPQATYAEPTRLTAGAEQVLVNGRFVVRDGRPTDALPGRALRHTPTAGTCP